MRKPMMRKFTRRKSLRISAAAALTGLYGAAVANAWLRQDASPEKINPVRITGVAVAVSALTWVATLA